MVNSKEILKEHISKLISLTEEQLDYVFEHFHLMSVKKGQRLISEGDLVHYEYFVLEGCLKSFYLNDNMKMFILQFVRCLKAL